MPLTPFAHFEINKRYEIENYEIEEMIGEIEMLNDDLLGLEEEINNSEKKVDKIKEIAILKGKVEGLKDELNDRKNDITGNIKGIKNRIDNLEREIGKL